MFGAIGDRALIFYILLDELDQILGRRHTGDVVFMGRSASFHPIAR